MTKKVAILGAGAWGTAFATLLARNGYQVALWCFEPDVACSIVQQRVNHRYLPDMVLHEAITATCDLNDALDGAYMIFEAVPVAYLRSVLLLLKDLQLAALASTLPWIILSKGIEQESLLVPSQILEQVLSLQAGYAVVGGPNFAKELAKQSITATIVASKSADLRTTVCSMLSNHYFKPYPSADVFGVQLCGALKNVLALLAGIANGMGAGENTTAFLLTTGLAEIATLCVSRGGTFATVYGLAGLGDMIATCTSHLSKNFKAGTLLGQGMSIAQITDHIPVLPEGFNTVQAIYQLMQQESMSLPLCNATYQCIVAQKPFAVLLQDFLAATGNP